MMDVKSMTHAEIDIAVARAMGWRLSRNYEQNILLVKSEDAGNGASMLASQWRPSENYGDAMAVLWEMQRMELPPRISFIGTSMAGGKCVVLVYISAEKGVRGMGEFCEAICEAYLLAMEVIRG